MNIIKKNIDDKKIIIMQNFLNNPNYCLKYLVENLNHNIVSDKSNYPGYRINIPFKLDKEIINFMTFMNQKYYKLKGNIIENDVFFSVINKKNNLNLKEILPHRDCQFYEDHYKSGLALVLYLCKPNENYGGTKFFNLKLPIYTNEFINNIKYKKYTDKLNYLNKNPKYNPDLRDIFQEIYNCKIQFNKAVLYKTNYYHAADINSIDDNFPRYTITAFLLFDEKHKKNKDDLRIHKLNNPLNELYLNGSENEIVKSLYKF